MPGLVDNVAQGVRRSKIALTGPEISTIFRPVLQEIVALVNRQIASTRRTVKAGLLVGGFGQSAYLRESLRSAIGGHIKVMVPPYGLATPSSRCPLLLTFLLLGGQLL